MEFSWEVYGADQFFCIKVDVFFIRNIEMSTIGVSYFFFII